MLADPRRDVVLQHIRFVPLKGTIGEYRLYVLLAPHLGNRGAGNTGWTGGYKGIPMLLAEGHGNALALASSAPWLARSAGFVGASDGWQDLAQHKRMSWRYERAENGNVALTGEIDLAAAADGVVLALGFGRQAEEAAHHALASLQDGFQAARDGYGRPESARALLRTLEACASDGGLLPEQVWDSADIPELELYFGRPSGSAMPLVWAHAEHLKLVRSLHQGQVFDLPPQPVQRYQVEKITSPYRPWRSNHKCRAIPAGKTLRIEVLAPAMIHWSLDDWRTAIDTTTRDTGFGVHIADLPVPFGSDGRMRFTFPWLDDSCWEGADYEVGIAPG